jgi:hypothetical protein
VTYGPVCDPLSTHDMSLVNVEHVLPLQTYLPTSAAVTFEGGGSGPDHGSTFPLRFAIQTLMICFEIDPCFRLERTFVDDY